MSDELRGAFLASVEAGRPDLALLEGLASCAGIVPDAACGMMAVSRGSTYAEVARLLRAREAGPLRRAAD